MSIRALAEQHLVESIEGGFGIEVILTDKEGKQQTVKGQVLYSRKVQNPITGEDIIVNEPVIVLRVSTLDPVPKTGEQWFIQMPLTPLEGAPKENFLMDKGKAVEGGASIGFIRLYPKKADQTPI